MYFKAKYINNKQIYNLDKLAEKILDKIKDNQTFYDKLKASINENKNCRLQLTYLGNYITLIDTFSESWEKL